MPASHSPRVPRAAQDAQGTVWHGRNLDFGLFMGVNASAHAWILVKPLQDVLVNVQYTKGGAILFNSTTCAPPPHALLPRLLSTPSHGPHAFWATQGLKG